jgi:hypothetical protein
MPRAKMVVRGRRAPSPVDPEPLVDRPKARILHGAAIRWWVLRPLKLTRPRRTSTRRIDAEPAAASPMTYDSSSMDKAELGPDEDEKFFQTIIVNFVERFDAEDGRSAERSRSIAITQENLSALVANAIEDSSSAWGTGVHCVISGATAQDEEFTSREHFVPEGLGFAWAVFPAGVGTCDRVNRKFGQYETEWLRQGLMGTFRPFFVAEGKDDAPAFYAPTKNEKAVWLTREADGRRVLCYDGTTVKDDLPDACGPGFLSIDVPRSQARPEWVSLSLHKVALLLLWLSRGSMALDCRLDGVRRFLTQPARATYLPFWEEMVPGSTPGVTVTFLVSMAGGVDGDQGRFGVDRIAAVMQVHHMRYGIVLAGDRVPPAPEGALWQEWRDPSEKPPDTTRIGFAFSSLART